MDFDGNLVYSGKTDESGGLIFNITFTDDNYDKSWKLIADLDGETVSKEMGLLSSTPILLQPSKGILEMIIEAIMGFLKWVGR
jgi:hypothetical protein